MKIFAALPKIFSNSTYQTQSNNYYFASRYNLDAQVPDSFERVSFQGKGLDFVNNSSNDKVAKSIIEFFPDTSLADLEKVIERYKEQEAWPTTTEFSKESFEHLQKIMIAAGELDKIVPYEELITVND